MSGLIESLNIAKSGMNVQQTALQTTAHNISNADTPGYSVQRANVVTNEPYAMPSVSSPSGAGQLGTGADVESVTRARDGYLDNQLRKENATLSKYQTREQFLSEIEAIFDEPSKEGLQNDIIQFWDAWNQLGTNPESPTAKTLVEQNAETLATNISHNYKQLGDEETNANDYIKQDVFNVASLLKRIGNVSEQIKVIAADNQQPNDLLDTRDSLLDQLAQKFGYSKSDLNYDEISVTPNDSTNGTAIIDNGHVKKGLAYVSNVSYDASHDQWKVTGNIDGDDNKVFNVNLSDTQVQDFFQDKTTINGIEQKLTNATVSDSQARSIIEYIKEGHSDADITAKLKSYNGNVAPDSDTVNSIKSMAAQTSAVHTAYYDYDNYNANGSVAAGDITAVSFDNGSISGNETISDEINQYKTQLNNLARSIAITVNTVYSNSYDPTKGTNFFDSAAEDPTKNSAELLAVNIDFVNDNSKISPGKINNAGNGEKASAIGALQNVKIDLLNIQNRSDFIKNVVRLTNGSTVNDSDVDPVTLTVNLSDSTQVKFVSSVTGTTINGYFQNTITTLGVSNQEARNMDTTQTSLISQMSQRKASVSGVSIDEEVTNMIQFNKAYQANAKMISVINELLDTVINGMIK